MGVIIVMYINKLPSMPWDLLDDLYPANLDDKMYYYAISKAAEITRDGHIAQNSMFKDVK